MPYIQNQVHVLQCIYILFISILIIIQTGGGFRWGHDRRVFHTICKTWAVLRSIKTISIVLPPPPFSKKKSLKFKFASKILES